jgi:ubiquinone biosynthesis protein Coq4
MTAPPAPSTSPWLDDPRIREWVTFHSLRRNDPGVSLIEGLPEMVQAVDEVRDRERIEALIQEERRRNPVVDRWFGERFISDYTLADLGQNPEGSLGRLLHDHMIALDLSLELLPQRQADPAWAPASDLDYYTLRSGQTHDFDHLLGECGFDCIGEVFPAGLRAGNLFAHLSPELAGALHTTTMFVTFPWLMRTMLHYPQIWNTVWDNFAHGHEVGRASPPLFTVKWEEVLHLSPAEARAALGVRGFRGPADNRAASLVFGEGHLII